MSRVMANGLPRSIRLLVVLSLFLLAGCTGIVHHRGYMLAGEDVEQGFYMSEYYYSKLLFENPVGTVYLRTMPYEDDVYAIGPLLPIIPLLPLLMTSPDSVPTVFIECDIAIYATDSLVINWSELSVTSESGEKLAVSEALGEFRPSVPMEAMRDLRRDGGDIEAYAFKCEFPKGMEAYAPFVVNLPVFSVGGKSVNLRPMIVRVVAGTHLAWPYPW